MKSYVAAGSLVLAVLVAAAAPAPAQDDAGLRDGESVREWDAYYPDAVPETEDFWASHWVVRIVDEETGEPIPGARVSVPYHWAEGVPPDLLHNQCEGVADNDGWVRLPWASIAGYRDYVIADAAGYAANEYADPGSERCELRRGVDVPFVLLDYVGRPVPGAAVGFNLGCAHIPDQRSATTDATGHGVLREIKPSRHRDLFLQAPRIHSGTARLSSTWREGCPPVEIHGVPGQSATGRLLGRDGQPLARVEVGSETYHRPWTRTDDDGRFTLHGLTLWSKITARLPRDQGENEVWFWAPPEGVERTYRVGEPTTGSAVTVTIAGDDGTAAGDVRVVAVRDGNGATSVTESDEHGLATLDLPPGSYRLLADGDFGEWGLAETRVEVGAEPLQVAVSISRNPVLRVDVDTDTFLDRSLRVGVTTQTGFRLLDEETLRSGRIPVPTERPAAIRISGWSDVGELVVRFFELGEVSDTAPPLLLDWHPSTRVTADVTGPDGNPIDAWLYVDRQADDWSFAGDDHEASPKPETTTVMVGTFDWAVMPVDAAYAPVYGTTHIADRGGELDLGAVRCPAAAEQVLRIVMPAGHADDGDGVAVLRELTSYTEWSDPGPDGSYTVPAGTLTPGDHITIAPEGDDMRPFTTRLPETPPPWTIVYPTGGLTLRARASFPGVDEDDGPLPDAVVLIDGSPVDLDCDENGAIAIGGISDGRHEIIVAETDHIPVLYELIWRDGETREFDVRLRPRPEE